MGIYCSMGCSHDKNLGQTVCMNCLMINLSVVGVSCVQFDDNRIVSGSSDKTIKVDRHVKWSLFIGEFAHAHYSNCNKLFASILKDGTLNSVI